MRPGTRWSGRDGDRSRYARDAEVAQHTAVEAGETGSKQDESKTSSTVRADTALEHNREKNGSTTTDPNLSSWTEVGRKVRNPQGRVEVCESDKARP
ncbi:hypothetical protein WMY93_004257 [Mugilogobius chulae]|uniref:Uncharacterized protein n=1 Tax=Mugilogobius chulae TaxID=88201 RepID=A0AAW0PRJ4_9GOBI